MRRALWFDGAFRDPDVAHVSPFDVHWRAGRGIFESFCVARDGAGRAQALFEPHRRRMIWAAGRAGCAPVPAADWCEVFTGLLERAGLERARGRVSLYPPGARPRFLASVEPLEDLDARRARGLQLVTSPYAFGVQDPVVGVKYEARRLYDIARDEARARGAGDALLFGPDGMLRETTRGNVFVADTGGDGRVRYRTPTITDTFLAGVAREVLVEALEAEGVEVREGTLDAADLTGAGEILVTNGVVGVEPVTRIDGREYEIGPQLDRCLQILRRKGMPC